MKRWLHREIHLEQLKKQLATMGILLEIEIGPGGMLLEIEIEPGGMLLDIEIGPGGMLLGIEIEPGGMLLGIEIGPGGTLLVIEIGPGGTLLGIEIGPGGMLLGIEIGPGGMLLGIEIEPGGMLLGIEIEPGGMLLEIEIGPGGMLLGIEIGPGGMLLGIEIGPGGMLLGIEIGPGGMLLEIEMGPGGMLLGIEIEPGGMLLGIEIGPGGMLLEIEIEPGGMLLGIEIEPGGMLLGIEIGPGGMLLGIEIEPGGMLLGIEIEPGGMLLEIEIGPGDMLLGIEIGPGGMFCSNNYSTSSQSLSASEDDDKEDYKRKSRNASEKKRRDQFNILINELCAMVSTKSRKMDKSSVLKATIAFLRQHNELTVRSSKSGIEEGWKPSFLSDDEFSTLMLEALDGFMLVVSPQGHILYASDSITTLLGHLPNDYQDCTIYEFIHEDDRPEMYKILAQADPSFGNSNTDILDRRFRIKCHILKSSANPTANPVYEPVLVNGNFTKRVDEVFKFDAFSAENPYVFVATVRLQRAQLETEIALVTEKGDEFTSRHSLDWKFLFLDHRGPPIIGYLPFEVLGTSGYDYYHQDDLEKLAKCHEALMQTGEGTSCHHRFLTKGQEWIWLQTRYYISYNQWNSKPEFIVCNHKVVSYADVRAESQRELGILSDKEMQVSDDPNASDSFKQDDSSSECFSPPPVITSTEDDVKLPSTPPGNGVAEISRSKEKTDWHAVPGYCQSESDELSTSSGREEEPTSESHVQSLFMPTVSHQENSKITAPMQTGMLVESMDITNRGNNTSPVNMSAIQVKLQEQLVEKHRKLQETILKQQQELHQVQAQLMMAQQLMSQQNPVIMQQLANQQANQFQQQQQQQQLQSQQQFLAQAGQHPALQGQNAGYPAMLAPSLGMSGFSMSGLMMMLQQQQGNQLQPQSVPGNIMSAMAVPKPQQMQLGNSYPTIQLAGQQLRPTQEGIVLHNPQPQIQLQPTLIQQHTSPFMQQQPALLQQQQQSLQLPQQQTSLQLQQQSSQMLQQSSPMLQQQSSPMLQQQSSPMLQQQSSPMLQQQSSPMLQQQSSPMLQQQSSPMLQQQSSPMLQQQSSSMLQQQHSPLMQQQHSPLMQQQQQQQQQQSPLMQQQQSPIMQQQQQSPLMQQQSSPYASPYASPHHT
ncbi:uncharacterized protein LOC144438750 [Glandiceps talaboti]